MDLGLLLLKFIILRTLAMAIEYFTKVRLCVNTFERYLFASVLLCNRFGLRFLTVASPCSSIACIVGASPIKLLDLCKQLLLGIKGDIFSYPVVLKGSFRTGSKLWIGRQQLSYKAWAFYAYVFPVKLTEISVISRGGNYPTN